MPRQYNAVSPVDGEFNFLNNVEKNTDTYFEVLDMAVGCLNTTAKLRVPSTMRLLQTEEVDGKFVIALVCDSAEQVLYYIKCNVVKDTCLPSESVTQVLLWRTQDIDYQQVTSGLADKVFLNVLLKEYNIVASDANQTTQGRDFWVRMLGTVMREGYSVYRYDSWASECTYVQLKDHADIRDNSVDLWGDGEEYEHILALITKDPI